MVNLMEYAENKKEEMLSSEGCQRRLDILNKVAEGEIWLEVGRIDLKGRRVLRHGWTSVRLERLIKELKEMDERVRDRIVYNGSLLFLINGKVKDKIIKRNLWGAKNRESYSYFDFDKEEDKDKVVRFRLQLADLIAPWTLIELIEKLEELQNLKI